MNFKNLFFIFLWVFSCFKVGDNVCDISCNGVTKPEVQNLVQIKSILLNICEKVLATISGREQSSLRVCPISVSKGVKWVRSFQFNIIMCIYLCFLGFKSILVSPKNVLLSLAQCLHLLPFGFIYALSLLLSSYRFIRRECYVVKYFCFYFCLYDSYHSLDLVNFIDIYGYEFDFVLLHRSLNHVVCLLNSNKCELSESLEKYLIFHSESKFAIYFVFYLLFCSLLSGYFCYFDYCVKVLRHRHRHRNLSLITRRNCAFLRVIGKLSLILLRKAWVPGKNKI